jgi:hypothetical protein
MLPKPRAEREMYAMPDAVRARRGGAGATGALRGGPSTDGAAAFE